MRSIFFRWIIWAGIALVAAARIHMALTRAFDPDEFAYLHWTWLSFNGYLPYRDFFFYIIPGFPWILSVILGLTGESTTFLLATRVFMAIIYGLCAAVVYRMTRTIMQSKKDNAHTPGVWVPSLAVLIFLTFPVTIDKTIDIRPDMVMLLLYFASVWLILQPEKVRPFQAKYVISGIVFGLSILVFPKIVFGLPALVYLLYRHKSGILPWLVGAGLVGLGFLGYLGFNTLIPEAITSITKDALAVTSGKGSFSPLTLLSPYPLIYLSSGGVSLPWAVNTGVWILGIVGLFVLFKKNRHWAIFWSLFIAGNILFVVLFPVPYVQYLLPLSVAGSVLAGLAIEYIGQSIWYIGKKDLLANPFLHTIPYILTPLLLLSFFLQYRERVATGAGNPEQLQVIRDVLRVTKPDESVYDMVGSYVFRPDGYYICCHPYAEFSQKLQAQGPASRLSLRESLIARQTKFLVMDRVGFVFWKSLDADKVFLLTNYLPMGNPAAPASPLAKLYSLGLSYRCLQGACVQHDMDGKPAAPRSTNTFTIIAPETYTVSIEPNSSSIMIDGKEARHGLTLDLGAGIHRFTVSPDALSFHLQLTR